MKKFIPFIAMGLFVGSLSVSVSGCNTASLGYQKITFTELRRVSQASTLGAGDVFEIRVYREKELSGIFRVPASGIIEYPLIGRIMVLGMTPSEVESIVRNLLKNGYLKNPWVSVYVRQYNSKKITVLGQVNKPGSYSFEQDMHIIQAISLAGGFTNIARSNFIIVTRREKGIERRIPVPAEKISKGLAKNFFLRPGDIVFVPETVL